MKIAIPYKIHARFHEWRHNRSCKPVLDSTPITPADDGLILFSMIGTRVVLPYLVAVKSLWNQLRRGRVVILDDGTLTAADRQLLDHHLGGPAYLSLAQTARPAYPAGGCWERLAGLLALRRDAYVIQLDSDTVTIGPVPEVAAAIDAGKSFTLAGDLAGAKAGRMNARHYARAHYPGAAPNDHIQTAMEMALADIEGGEDLFYIRGCAGFSGFAPALEGHARADALVRRYRERIGDARIAQWGSEQFMSNLLIANEPDSQVLPYDRYFNYWGEPWGQDMRFVHFIGTHRYAHGAYSRATRQALAALN